MAETENGTEDIWWILEGQDYPQLTWELIEEGSMALAILARLNELNLMSE
ncbi:MAG: hypothetical protein ACYS19_01590 [Planctomycetota bacterium]